MACGWSKPAFVPHSSSGVDSGPGIFTALSGHADAYSPLEGEALISVGGMITNGPPPFFNCPWLKTSITPSEMITVAAAIQRLIPLSWDDSVSEPV
jgi:hypothetical protein